MLTLPRTIGTALFLCAICSTFSSAQEIKWSGYEWTVRSNPGGPGPNQWSKDNVSIDSDGMLHLKISREKKTWYCAELFTKRAFGYGQYQFSVIGRVDELDKNVVLGLFSYPEPDVGPDGTNELDIEFSHWGNLSFPIGNYTAYPNAEKLDNISHTFDFRLHGPDTTQRYTWRAGSVNFQTLKGHTDGNADQIDRWQTPASFSKHVASKPMPVHMNLWLFAGKPPSDDKPVEVILKAFKFTP